MVAEVGASTARRVVRAAAAAVAAVVAVAVVVVVVTMMATETRDHPRSLAEDQAA